MPPASPPHFLEDPGIRIPRGDLGRNEAAKLPDTGLWARGLALVFVGFIYRESRSTDRPALVAGARSIRSRRGGWRRTGVSGQLPCSNWLHALLPPLPFHVRSPTLANPLDSVAAQMEAFGIY